MTTLRTDVGTITHVSLVPAGHCFQWEHSVMLKLSDHLQSPNDTHCYALQILGAHVHEVPLYDDVVYLGTGEFILGHGKWTEE